MKISIATSVYVNYSIEGALRQIAAAGYDGVDLWGGRPHIYRQDHSRTDLRRLRALLADVGLGVPSLMPAFFRYPHSLSSPSRAIRNDSLDYMRECIDSAVELGAACVLIVPGRSLHDQTREDAWERLAESVSRVCSHAQQYDICLSVEPVNRWVSDLINTAADALRLIEQVQCDKLGVTLDSGHVHLSNESAREAIERLGDRLLQVHVNDNDGQHQQNLILGRGTFDFSTFLSDLRDAGYDGYLTAELAWEYTLDPDPAARETAQIMRRMLG